jgi:hypothetical protein
MKQKHPNGYGWVWVGLAGWAIMLTAVFYGRSLALPFFFDDLDHLPYVARTTLPEIWQSAGGFPYFRPLGATVWRLSYLLWGGHNPVWLHAVNLALHALNGWLVGWLAFRLWQAGTRRRSVIVAPFAIACFLLFPFSYQAVPWVGALYHLLATTLVLTAVVTAQKWQISHQNRWLALSLTAVFLAPFAHENGLIAAPLIMALQLLDEPPPTTLRRFTFWLYPVIALLWLPIWWLAPKARDTGEMALNNLETIGQNLAYFTQGLAFPFTWLGGWLRDTRGWSDLATAVLLSGLALALVLLTAVVLRRLGWRSLLLFGFPLLWWLLASLPAILLLKFAYVISAPRLLMLPSVGAALLWALVAGTWLAYPQTVLDKQPSAKNTNFSQNKFFFSALSAPSVVQKFFAPHTAGILIALAILPAGWFITDHMNQHEKLGRVWWQLVEAVNQAPEQKQDSIFINFPGGLVNPTTFYPLGHEGTVFNVSYIPPERIYEVNSGRALSTSLRFRRYDDIKPQLPYLYGVLDQGQDWPELVAQTPNTAVYNTRYTTSHIWLEPVGGWPSPQATAEPLAVFPDYDLALLAGSHTAVSPDFSGLVVTLHWSAPRQLGYEWTTFVHLLDTATGDLITQADGHALANTYPMGQWPENASLWEQRHVALPAGVRAEQVVTAVGLYNWQTGERLVTQDGDTAVTLPLITKPMISDTYHRPFTQEYNVETVIMLLQFLTKNASTIDLSSELGETLKARAIVQYFFEERPKCWQALQKQLVENGYSYSLNPGNFNNPRDVDDSFVEINFPNEYQVTLIFYQSTIVGCQIQTGE